MPYDGEPTIIVQFKTSKTPLGTMDEFEWRVSTEEYLGQVLEDANLGSCDGGQMGAGSMEMFFDVTDLEPAVKLIIKTLIDQEWIGFAKVVTLENGDEDYNVRHPAGAKFSMWSEVE